MIMTTSRTRSATGRFTAKPKIDAPDDFQAAWSKEKPRPDAWTPRPWVPVEERAALGRAARQRAPRSSQGALELAPDRDPVAHHPRPGDRTGSRTSCPLRHGRMAASAFAFYRGAPAVMAFDLSTTPRSNIIVQASGDAHCSNFGLFASPERSLVFDSNDFDETLPGPVGVGRQAARGQHRHRRAEQRLQRSGDANGDDGDGAQLPREHGALRRACVCSTSGTTRRPRTTSSEG